MKKQGKKDEKGVRQFVGKDNEKMNGFYVEYGENVILTYGFSSDEFTVTDGFENNVEVKEENGGYTVEINTGDGFNAFFVDKEKRTVKMIIDLRYDKHPCHTECSDQRLLGKIVHIIPEICLCLIRTRTVKHNKPETHQEYDHHQKVEIKILLLYPGPAPAFRDHCRQTGAFRRSRRARRLPPLPCMSHISCAPDTFRSGSLPAGTVLRHRLGSTDHLTPPVNGPLITFIARAYTYRPHWLRI